jgi:dihydroxyacid dehydratase/phosphogluconate dehydratase
VSTGACVGHVSPEAWAGGPIGKVQDNDQICLRIDTKTLEGRVELVGVSDASLAARGMNPKLKPDPRVPADTRLWAALQSASGGSWGGCVYDVDRITEIMAKGLAAESDE